MPQFPTNQLDGQLGAQFVKVGLQDPSVTATDGVQGVLFLRAGPSGGTAYLKQDNGTTTNWVLIDTGLTAKTAQIDGLIELPTNKTYIVSLKNYVVYNIEELAIKLNQGTCTATVQINGVNVTGLTALAVTTVLQSFTATANNTNPLSGLLTLIISNTSNNVIDLAFSIKTVRP